MKWMLVIILAVNFYVHNHIILTCASDANVAVTTEIDDQKNLDTFTSTGSADVRCTTIDDVIATRRSLCPAQCSCSPLEGQDVLTRLTVNCSGAQFNDSTLSQNLTQLLSRCVSKLTDLTVTDTPLTGASEVLCRLSKLRSLDISRNRFWSLPSNCFTRMPNLTSFTANYNGLRFLQVCCEIFNNSVLQHQCSCTLILDFNKLLL